MKYGFFIILICNLMMVLVPTCVNADEGKVVVHSVEATEKQLNALNQSEEGLIIKKTADGGEMVDLKGRFQMYTKVVMVDGSPYYTCQSHPGLHQDMHKHIKRVEQSGRAVK